MAISGRTIRIRAGGRAEHDRGRDGRGVAHPRSPHETVPRAPLAAHPTPAGGPTADEGGGRGHRLEESQGADSRGDAVRPCTIR